MAVLQTLYELIQWTSYELGGPYTGDSPIYWGVGRGILNGLTPYADMWESKPPGIFLLSALSFWLTGDITLGSVAQAIVILGIPIIFAAFALRSTRKAKRLKRFILLLLMLSVGTVFGLYSGWRSGQFQTESFGAFFAVLYVILIARHRHDLHKRSTLAASLCMLCSIGFKEPFLLSMCASALLLSPTQKSFVRIFVIPLLIAVIIGGGIMAMLGYLGPYVEIYLPEMIGNRIQGDIAGYGTFQTLWKRGLEFELLISDLSDYSTAFIVLVVLFLSGAFFFAIEKSNRHGTLLLRVITILAAIYLLSLSVGIGGTWWRHHFIFALPAYAALAILFFRYLTNYWHLPMAKTLLVLATFSVVATSYHTPPWDLRADLTSQNTTKTDMKTISLQIDSILNTCNIDRYLFLGSYRMQPYAYTEHSPFGPLFFQFDYWLDDEKHTFFRDRFIDNIHNAQFIVFYDYAMDNTLKTTIDAYINENFSKDPWPCAEPFHHPKRWYTFLYRKT